MTAGALTKLVNKAAFTASLLVVAFTSSLAVMTIEDVSAAAICSMTFEVAECAIFKFVNVVNVLAKMGTAL